MSNFQVLFLVTLTLLLKTNSSINTPLSSGILTELKTSTSTTFSVPSISAICFLNMNSIVFDLFPLNNPDGDYLVGIPDGFQLILNFCGRPKYSCRNSGSLINYKNNSTCYALSGQSLFSNFRITNNPNYGANVLTQVFQTGDACASDPTAQYQTSINYVCTTDKTTITVNTTTFNIQSCVNSIDVITNFACPNYGTYGLWLAFKDNQAFVSFTFFMLGLYFLTIAKRFYKATQIVSGITLSVFTCLFVVLNNVSQGILPWQLMFAVVFSSITGVLAGFFFTKLPKGAPMALAGLCGYIFGLIFYRLFLVNIEYSQIILYFCSTILCAAGGALWGFYYNLIVVLVSINFLGSYLVIKAIANFLGGYPDERQIYDLLTYGETNQLNKIVTNYFYLYLIGLIGIAILGYVLQWKYFTSDQEKSTKQLDGVFKEKRDDEDDDEQEYLNKNK